MSKFKKGDRVYMKSYPDVIGTVVRQHNMGTVTVEIDGEEYVYSKTSMDLCKPLDSYTIPQIIAHFGYENILDEIGEEMCKEYFNSQRKTHNHVPVR